MLFKALRRLATSCPPAGRQLGLLREHEDIAKRHARVRQAWATHLAESRRVVLETAQRCAQRRRAVVIGAGDCLDVPVAELAAIFDEVVLADIVTSAEVRRWERKLRGKVRAANWDASGALAKLAAVRETVTGQEAVEVFAQADPGPAPGGEPDFMVSANCISQLGLVPGHSLPAMEKDKGLPDRLAKVAAKRHLEWLERQPGVRLLRAHAARLDLAPDGHVLKRETLHERFGLPKPARTWRWDLAPIPEWSREFHRVHDVGAWIWEPVPPSGAQDSR